MKINMSLQTRLLTLSHTQSATAATGSTFESKIPVFFNLNVESDILHRGDIKTSHA